MRGFYCFVLDAAKILAVAALVFAALAFVGAVGFRLGYQSGKDSTLRAIKLRYLTPGAWHTASAADAPTDYGRLEYALDVHPEEWQDLPSVKEMADWLSRTNVPASGGWVAVGGKEVAQ